MRSALWYWRIAALGALMILSLTVPGASAAELQPLKIRVNSPGVVGLAPLYLALEKGYFTAEGLDVEIAEGVAKNGGMEIVAALTDGRLDIATIAPSAGLFNALTGGVNLTGLYVLNTVTPSDRSSGIVVRQDHLDTGRYKSAEDLKGMKIAVGAIGSSSHYNVLKALEKAGLSAEDAVFVAMPFPDALLALGNASIDAAFEVEPFISTAQGRRIGRLVIPSSETSPSAPSILVYGNADFIAKNRAGVERYVYALQRGQRAYEAAVDTGVGREELHAALAKYTQVKDRTQLEHMNYPTVDPNGVLDEAAMNDLQIFFLRTGGLQKALTANQIIDMHFTAAAARLEKAK